MPTIGERCRHDCPECGQPMYWSEGGGPREAESLSEYLDAYRCANGHRSKECPECGSYDTAAWRNGEEPAHYHVICAACGNDSIVYV